MNREEIREKKRHGDLATAAEMIGVTRDHAAVIWQRPESKRYYELETALVRIIEAREQCLVSKVNN